MNATVFDLGSGAANGDPHGAVAEAGGLVELPVLDLSVSPETSKRLYRAEYCGVAIAHLDPTVSFNFRALRRVVVERLRGRHSAAWGLKPSGFEIHLALGSETSEDYAHISLGRLALDVATMLGDPHLHVERADLRLVESDAVWLRSDGDDC